MKRNFFLGVAAFGIIISLFACAFTDTGSHKTVKSEIDTGYNGDKGAIPVTIDTVDELLEDDSFEDATKFDEDLAIVSLVIANQTSTEEKIRELYSTLGFDNIVCNDNYDSNSADSISYCIGHFKDGSYDMVTVAARGLNYGREWASNFDIGESGDHRGFTGSANKVYDALTSYINSKYKSSYDKGKVKLWLCGYSRGAAVINVLSYMVLADPSKKLNIPQKNVFSYTFNTPKGLTAEHATAFPNVFNIVNSADLVGYIAPEAYGMYRCGRDINLLESKESDYKRKSTQEEEGKYINETVWYESKADSLSEIPKFRLETFSYKRGKAPGESTIPYGTTEKAAIDWLLNMVMTDGGIENPKKGHSFKTREKFATTVQPYLSYAIELVLGNTVLMDEIADKFKNDALNTALRWFMQEDGIYNDVKEILDKNQIDYNDAALRNACTGLFEMADYQTYQGCLTNTILKLIPMAMGSNKDLARMISMHQMEVALDLILDKYF